MGWVIAIMRVNYGEYVNELYKINGAKFYTEDYIKANNIQKGKHYAGEDGWSVAIGLGTNKDDFRIYTAEGVKIAYAYGEKTWFDKREMEYLKVFSPHEAAR